MANKPQPTRQFLENPIFEDLHRRVEIHARLLKKVKEAVPGAMAGHCLHCVAREDGSLVLYTDSQAFASQLRFHVPSILARLQAAGEAGVRRIAVRNLCPTGQAEPAEPIVRMKKPSAYAVEAVKACVRADGDELDAALARLGASMEQHTEKRP
jgi:hypothetical protein